MKIFLFSLIYFRFRFNHLSSYVGLENLNYDNTIRYFTLLVNILKLYLLCSALLSGAILCRSPIFPDADILQRYFVWRYFVVALFCHRWFVLRYIVRRCFATETSYLSLIKEVLFYLILNYIYFFFILAIQICDSLCPISWRPVCGFIFYTQWPSSSV